MKSTKLVLTIELVHESLFLQLIAKGNYHPATPDVPYLRNGDPGYPGDPEEVTDIEATINGTVLDLSEEQEGAIAKLIIEETHGQRDEVDPPDLREREQPKDY